VQFFCLDVGGTETRGALFDESGTKLAQATGIGGALSLGANQAEVSIRDVWVKITQATGPEIANVSNTALLAGIAGKGLPGRANDLATRLGDFAQTHFVGDGYGALLAATNGQPGAIISVGTGVTAIRLDEKGNTLALSGWGFPAGDLGSGAWLGLQLVGALTKHIDGVTFDPAFPSDLAEKTMQIVGHDPNDIMAWHTSAKPREYGNIAPLIVKSAEAGDPFCQQMLSAAASEIVNLAKALYPSEPGEVHLLGGLGAILSPYCINQAPQFIWQVSSADPVQGICLLATGRAPDENLIIRPGIAALKT